MKDLTKEQTFKNYVRTIEELAGDFRCSLCYDFITTSKETKRVYKELIEARKNFFEFFKKQINKELPKEYNDEKINGYSIGYNACLKEIKDLLKKYDK